MFRMTILIIPIIPSNMIMAKKKFISALLFIFAFNIPEVFALSLESSAFFNQDKLPVQFTCDGKDISPELSWKDAPSSTQSYALIMSDPDAPGGTFYHWVVYNIPATTTSLGEGSKQLPAGTVVGKTSWGKQQYNGPCPPKGSTHRYVISLYALNTSLTLPADSEAPAVLDALQNHVMGEADLKVTYSH